jgi:hypothetical protein
VQGQTIQPEKLSDKEKWMGSRRGGGGEWPQEKKRNELGMRGCGGSTKNCFFEY